MLKTNPFYFFILYTVFFAASCAADVNAPFSITDNNGITIALKTQNKKDAVNKIEAPNETKIFEYKLEKPFVVTSNLSLEITYTTENNYDNKKGSVALQFGKKAENGTMWLLPFDASFLKLKTAPNFSAIKYIVPLPKNTIDSFRIIAENTNGIEIKSLIIVEKRFGFAFKNDFFIATPFVTSNGITDNSVTSNGGVFTIMPKDEYAIEGGKTLVTENLTKDSVLSTQNFSYKMHGNSPVDISIPQTVMGRNPYPVTLNGASTSFFVRPSTLPKLPYPILADPGIILEYTAQLWREDNYEIFAWERFPNVLIFDTISYAVQDKFFKRLAFFVEKQGTRGTLTKDEDMKDVHGWNAHDYNAVSLASFFNLAQKNNFMLSKEENYLCDVLIANNIITRNKDGIYLPVGGAVLSISKESNGYLRNLFMAHECFHGLYFIDDDFRAFSKKRYTSFDRKSRQVLLEYFKWQNYDVDNNEELAINEFMSYLLQQSAYQAGEYFGKTVPSRLQQLSWRKTVLEGLPQNDGVWTSLASLFEIEAKAFAEYARSKWDYEGGRVLQIVRTR